MAREILLRRYLRGEEVAPTSRNQLREALGITNAEAAHLGLSDFSDAPDLREDPTAFAAAVATINPHKVWELLNRLNMTQNELARLVGTSSGYLSQLMSGTRCPSADMRKRLMEALGVTRFEDLFILEQAHV